MSEARKLKIQKFLAGILDDDDEQKSPLNSASKQPKGSDTLTNDRALEVEVGSDTKIQEISMDPGQGSKSKPGHGEHETSQHDLRNNIEDLHTLDFEKYTKKIEKQVEEKSNGGSFSSFSHVLQAVKPQK